MAESVVPASSFFNAWATNEGLTAPSVAIVEAAPLASMESGAATLCTARAALSTTSTSVSPTGHDFSVTATTCKQHRTTGVQETSAQTRKGEEGRR